MLRNNTLYNLRQFKSINYNEDKMDKYYDNINNSIKKNTSNRKRKRDIDDEYETIDDSRDKKKQKVGDLNIEWSNFNTNNKKFEFSDPIREWVSATAIKNYLLKDPLLDWLNIYYTNLGFNEHSQQDTRPTIFISKKKERADGIKNEASKLSILFEMGNKFEAEVIKYIRNKFPNDIVRVIENIREVTQYDCSKTVNLMNDGVPILEQVPLYNNNNKTFGVADLVVRSDWINKLIESCPISNDDINIKASKLKGNYHYRVIDIKWTTMQLCADGERIRNSQMFPAYKGQLTIYNAALGELQGYTPDKAYILAKAWKYEEKGIQYNGYNCFDLLGQIDFNTFDRKYINETKNAIEWVRNVRSNGSNWSCVPPTVEELYPNMCNLHDAPFHNIKRNLSDKLHELTSIWMVSVKNRKIAHKNGVFKWSDPKCSSKTLGINGKKIAPIVDSILKINNCDILISPKKIQNNNYNWQTETEFDMYVDFETINSCFYHTDINLTNSKTENSVIFMIGVGYVENKEWKYKCFSMNSFSIQEEKKVIEEFISFVESKQKINKTKPKLFHWGHAENSVFLSSNKRHNNIWTKRSKNFIWIDFCKIFQQEPIVIKGAKKFNLKEIASVMHKHKFIKTCWESTGYSSGLSVMIDATNFYKSLENNDKNLDMTILSNIQTYNEIDCKVVWEIVSYLRKSHRKSKNI